MSQSFYSESEVLPRLVFIEGWTFKQDAIHKSFVFKNFVQAFSFITSVALVAEKMDHHPDWSNSWNTVSISLSTHSRGGVTDKDLELANIINGLA
jgi:4a-hydroxytetrahydrobiopterin dehydratase